MPAELPEPGSRTQQLKVIEERHLDRSMVVTFSAPGNQRYELPVRFSRPGITVEGARISGDKLLLESSGTPGFRTQTVTFRW